MEPKHTPTPWYVTEDVGEDGEKGYYHVNAGVGFPKDENRNQNFEGGFHMSGWMGSANGKFLARAVNNHNELVDALANLLNGIDTGAITSDHDETFWNATRQAAAALKKARGEA